MSAKFRVETFGSDCLGNITGYRVTSGNGQMWFCHGTFCGNIYERGSFDRAHEKAQALAIELTAQVTP